MKTDSSVKGCLCKVNSNTNRLHFLSFHLDLFYVVFETGLDKSCFFKLHLCFASSINKCVACLPFLKKEEYLR